MTEPTLRGLSLALSNPALRRQTAPILLMLALAGPGQIGHAQQSRDPFDVQRLRPAAPSTFWEGPRGTCAAPLQVPDPLRLADAVDLALCNNPQTRQSWANAKVQAAQVGIARVRLSAQRRRRRRAPAHSRPATCRTPGGETNLNGALTFNYLLFDFGGRDAALEQARQSLLAADWTPQRDAAERCSWARCRPTTSCMRRRKRWPPCSPPRRPA